MNDDSWYVYILGCADGSLYTGVTRDTERRLRQHNGELRGGPKYTSGRRPVQLLWTRQVESRSEAQKVEASIKVLPRDQKLSLIEGL